MPETSAGPAVLSTPRARSDPSDAAGAATGRTRVSPGSTHADLDRQTAGRTRWTVGDRRHLLATGAHGAGRRPARSVPVWIGRSAVGPGSNVDPLGTGRGCRVQRSVVPAPGGRVTQDLVGAEDIPKAGRIGRRVGGRIWMRGAGKPAKGPADVLERRIRSDAQHGIQGETIVHVIDSVKSILTIIVSDLMFADEVGFLLVVLDSRRERRGQHGPTDGPVR